jgi:hypothetical protein
MSRLDPDKLTVEFREGVNERAPLIPRRYTFTHSELTQDIFLIIGSDFYYDKVSAKRNDVLGEWLYVEDRFRFYVFLHMAGENGQEINNGYYDKRLRDLFLALETIRYGDRQFFDSNPELDRYPIIVYFLHEDPADNKAENWGTFSDYDINFSWDTVVANSMMEYRVLLDEKIGDLNGDGILDRVSVYGNRLSGSDFIHSIIIEVEGGPTGWYKADMITELNGYHPTLFLGDFTKDHSNDILFQMDMMFNSMDSNDKGEYGVSIIRMKEGNIETIFTSDRYNTEYSFLVEYNDLFKISILSVKVNKLFFLDISDKDYDYLSQFYHENGELIKPVHGKVLKAEAFIPVINNEKEYSYDLLAIHRIVGGTGSDTLGYINNLLSWDGERFISLQMMASTPGMELIGTH